MTSNEKRPQVGTQLSDDDLDGVSGGDGDGSFLDCFADLVGTLGANRIMAAGSDQRCYNWLNQAYNLDGSQNVSTSTTDTSDPGPFSGFTD
jgi:hypothetical protein